MARLARLVAGMVLAWGLVLAPLAMAQETDELISLRDQVSRLHGAGKYAEAIPIAERYVGLARRRHGEEHAEFATAIAWLGFMYQGQGRYADAEPLYRRALAISEKALGPDHPLVGTWLNILAMLYQAQGRYADAEAEPLFVPLLKRALTISEKALGPDHPDVALSLNNLAALYQAQGRYAEAEPLFKRGLAISEKALGPNHREVGNSLTNLAELYRDQGRYAEAEPLFKRGLAISEKALGPNHPDVALSLNNLAALYQAQGRYADAEPLYKRSLAIKQTALGPDHANVGQSLNNLALLYQAQGRTDEAEQLYRRSLGIGEKALGRDHPSVGTALNNLALLYKSEGRTTEAEPLYRRNLAIKQKALGHDHPSVATALNNLAALYQAQGRTAEAEPLYRRGLAIFEKALGPDHPDVALSLNNLALLYFVQRDWARAAEYWRRSTGVLIRRAERGTASVGQALTSKGKSETERESYRFWGLVKVTHRLATEGGSKEQALHLKMFEAAQWAQSSEAAASLAQMAARGATGDPALARIVRERQDLVGEWQKRDAARSAAVSQPPDKRDKQAEAVNVAKLNEIDTRMAEIDKQLAKDFSDYAALASPKPLSLADVQSQISDREALVLFLDTPKLTPTPEETFIWVVTKSGSRWVKSELGTKALGDRVAALRCGLDSTNWTDSSGWSDATEDTKKRKEMQIARRERCKALTGADVTDKAPPPFDVAKAHDLYRALFGDIEELLKNPDGTAKQLLVVPSGPLTQLPFQVLVTEKPHAANAADYGSAAWLARRHAITVLPSVASLKALRQHAKTSKAARPFVGFGNPLLVGGDGSNKSAWAKQACPKEAPKPKPNVVAGWTLPETFSSLFRGGVADVAALRRQEPLPETADELCAVARELGAGDPDVNLGARATETRIKQLSTDGALAQVRVVHFATHGLIASETESVAKSLAEPALLLTPPDTATASDDGLLTASEVTELKLNADWVVLSACNTAAGGVKGDAEALSGLARAFFYAGAQALLVSHWYVDSRAAVKITTGAFAELKRDPAIGRAEALRRAMLAAMADPERPKTWTPAAHPAVWAPFVVVGEGGAGR